MAASDWKVVADPEGKNSDDRNEGSMVIYLTDGTKREELSRVGFARRNTANPDISFEDALEQEINKGKAALRAKRLLEEYSADATVIV